MNQVRIRFRTDSWHFADLKALGITWDKLKEWNYNEDCIKEFIFMEPAKPGDIWRVHWAPTVENPDAKFIAGYAIGCLKCSKVHAWTTATNCSQKYKTSYIDKDGKVQEYWTCRHSGVGSCWVWSGSAEDGTLTASPSLHCQAELGGCGFHGWLQNGVLKDC